MFDTYVTIVGNVLTAPEWRRTTQSGTLVANFKVASTARRLDRDSGRWVDGNSLRVRVNCWRKLAEGVASSVMVGDPIVVVGRMYTRDWTDDAGNHRTLYELEAAAVGHDLSRGRAKFLRNRSSLTTSSVEDAESSTRVHGEATESVPDEEAPVRQGDQPFDDEREYFPEAPASPAGDYHPAEPARVDPSGGDPAEADYPLAGPAATEGYAPDDFDDSAGRIVDRTPAGDLDGADEPPPLPGEVESSSSQTGDETDGAAGGETGGAADGETGGFPAGPTGGAAGRRGRGRGGRVPVPA
jgi:single-strand DNA-binding protein